MKRPMIGLTANTADDPAKIDIKINYLRSIEAAGGIPVVLPHCCGTGIIPELLEGLDGILLTGGGDVDPSYYGEEKIPQCHEPDAERDVFEIELLKLAREAGKPVLGICRGCQMMNAAMGGSLIQDIPSQKSSDVTHYQTADGSLPVHSVRILQGSLLHD
ncbi:MAG: type 1 glutamine amidotransferase, partial [Eubacteriaceae bacterium]|nr:type 1 glutamine amidotransferase [Eubacteriaceae bacterium]